MKIAIIGAGPRGLLIVQQVLAQLPKAQVKLFDPFSIGGQTWQTAQPANLIMNTPAEQVQEFDFVPNLFEWSQEQAEDFIKSEPSISDDLLQDLRGLAGNDYPTRRLFGAYLKFCFQTLPVTKHLKVEKSLVSKIEQQDGQWWLSWESYQEDFDQVVITISSGREGLRDQTKALFEGAQRNNLVYQVPSVQMPTGLIATIPASENVIIRGLGLNFYDILAQFLAHWQGSFYRNQENLLQYQSSGKEQQLIVGSRSGLPHYPRPLNQDGSDSERPGRFLSVEKVKRWAAAKGCSHYQAFNQLIRLEVELSYYKRQLKMKGDVDCVQFEKDFVAQAGLPIEYNLSPLDWSAVLNPLQNVVDNNYQSHALKWLDQVTADANRGSRNGFLLTGLDTIRGLYNTIRDIYIDPIISDDNFKNQFLTDFARHFTFLISGAPSFRLEQLSALIRAGVVELLPPKMEVELISGQFQAFSSLTVNNKFSANYLFEARQPSRNLTDSDNPLIKNLLAKGWLTHRILKVNDQKIALACPHINENYQVFNKDGQLVESLFVFSQLNEGERWLTNVCPRSGDDYARRAAQKIVRAIQSNRS
ncbi:FAD/NAD(P)-binding protein [Convivina praedatoris]|uniref:FAD-dependent urate hydroxylase HpyO/Asp monooxygenase CreE-like FAD/NAD(P)-binding domain-containing protein n=1 Tax=Convivina praedatoris TaxID=2880963 RepID=A0ABM9D5W2_9LACO|nr:FAD/NAD(P)-binding protein [Convivina sp. LMG 32447]CAH1854598.1 hypothetical protein R078138_00910 [Convivina sp. LMG 32447]CAH1857086.1 hypothetical protein R077815_01543 [Convivina sp. LMG 32447]CAH1857498.1 hypothetical protein LMG032447_01575 [Convivina sp. LMG 32447]